MSNVTTTTTGTTTNINPLQNLVNDSAKEVTIVYPSLSLLEKIQLIEKMYIKQLRAKDKDRLVYYFGTSDKNNLVTINLPTLLATQEKEETERKEKEETERKEKEVKQERKLVNDAKQGIDNEILTQLLKDNKAFDFLVNHLKGKTLDSIINSNLVLSSQRVKINPLQLEQLMKSWNLTRGFITSAQDDKIKGINERGRNFMTPKEVFNVWVKASCLKSTSFDNKKKEVFLEKVSK